MYRKRAPDGRERDLARRSSPATRHRLIGADCSESAAAVGVPAFADGSPLVSLLVAEIVVGVAL
jgi:hypothetical protein